MSRPMGTVVYVIYVYVYVSCIVSRVRVLWNTVRLISSSMAA